MNSLFDPNTRLFRIMSRITQLIGLNILTFLCCIPVITMGASFSAAHKVMHDALYGDEDEVIKPFFRAFRHSFKQSTVVWLVYLLLLLVCMFNIMMVDLSFTGTIRIIAYIILLALLVAFTCLGSVLFPLIGRYRNTLLEHLSNSLLLTLGHPLRAIAMAALNAFPFLLAYASLLHFLKSMVIWLTFGVGVIFLLDGLLMKKIYGQMDDAM